MWEHDLQAQKVVDVVIFTVHLKDLLDLFQVSEEVFSEVLGVSGVDFVFNNDLLEVGLTVDPVIVALELVPLSEELLHIFHFRRVLVKHLRDQFGVSSCNKQHGVTVSKLNEL